MKIYKVELAEPWGIAIVVAPDFNTAKEVIINDQYIKNSVCLENCDVTISLNDGSFLGEVGEPVYDVIQDLTVSGEPKLIYFDTHY